MSMSKIYLNEYMHQRGSSTYEEKLTVELSDGNTIYYIENGPVTHGGRVEVEESIALYHEDLLMLIDALVKAHDDKSDIPYAQLTDEDRLPNEEKTGL